MRPNLYDVRWPGHGRVSTMAKPRGGEWLDDEMEELRAVGVDELVCALTAAEAAEVGLAQEPVAAKRARLDFTSVPAPDFGLFDSDTARPELERLLGRFQAGDWIVFHCRFGIGRSSALAAAMLILGGGDPDEVWTAIGEARGLRVPDTPEQRAWTLQFAK
jgi:protein-tyrosine phosphatase